MRIFFSAEKCRRVALRMSLTVSSALCGACLSRYLILSLHVLRWAAVTLLRNQLNLSDRSWRGTGAV